MACASGHDSVSVGVHLRNNDLAQLTGQRGACFQLALRFVVVQLINVEDERTVMLQQQLLGGGIQVKQLTIARQGLAAIFGGGAAVAAVVVQRGCADLVQLDAVGTAPIEIGVSQQTDLAFRFEKLISLRGKFGSKLNGHIY